MAHRYFTLDQAQAALPRVRALLGRSLQLHGHLRTAISTLGDVGGTVSWPMLRGEEELEDLEPEVADALERARMIYQALRESVVDIEAEGVEVKGIVDGLIDFPSWHDGKREVVLCFKLGEAEIGFFHGVEDGFAGRRPVAGERFTAEPDADGDSVSSPQGA